MKISRLTRLALLPLLAVLFSFVMAAGLLVASPAPAAQNHLGLALALRAALRPLAPASAHPKALQDFGAPKDLRRASDGRYIYRKPDLMHPGAIVRPRAAGTAAAQVDEAVQTFDVFNPPPAFALASGQSLTPTNLTPVWTADETMLIFSSNRTSTGAAGTRFHIWAIPVNGGTPVQLTSSTAAAGETAGLPHGEFFPALSSGNNQVLAFTSDANTPNVQNLYVTSFPGALFTVNGQPSLTSQGTATGGAPVTGFNGIQRPAFAPGNDDEVVFSALSVTGTYAGHQHLYFLYRSTGGYSQSTISLPAKLTDGPADDTDPAFSQDGQFLAFASTGTQIAATGAAPSADPNTSIILTSAATGTTAASNRSIFLVTSGGALVTFSGSTTGPSGLPVTASGTDNFAPAWSSAQTNPYLNPAPGFEYIAFSRGAAQGQPHDIYYLKLLQNTQAGGQSSRSNEASSTPLNSVIQPFGPVYQVNAGGTTGAQTYGGYVPDTFINPNTGLPSFIVTGGTADPPANPPIVFNTAGDPGTPPQIYQTDRSGTFTYQFPNLTPNATYRVRLHLADPKDTAAGARIFNVTVNGGITEPNIDIVRIAQQSPGQLDGLVTDASKGTALSGATVTIQATTPAVFQTFTPPVADPNPSGTGSPINYNGAITSGTYTVVASAPGYGSVSKVVTINSAVFTRADFALSPGTATFSGDVTLGSATGTGLSGVVISVIDATSGSTVVTSPSPVTTSSTGAYGPVTIAPGTYYITATPPVSSGFTTQTQKVTVTAATPPTVNFVLQATTSASVGTLGGLITSTTPAAALANATVTVIDANNNIVAILTSGASFNSPAPPNGDSKAVNYYANLPVGTYTLTITDPGFTTVQTSVTVANTPTPAPGNAFVRKDVSLTTTSPTAGQPVAVVVEYLVTVPNNDTFNNKNLNIAPRGAITLAFNPVSGDPPIVQGIEILADPNQARSSGFGTLGPVNTLNASTTPQISGVFGGSATTVVNNISTQNPFTTVNIINRSAQLPAAYNIFRSAGSPTGDNEPPVSGAGTESGTIYQTIAPSTTSRTTVFTDPNVNFGSEYFYQVAAVFQEAIVPEGQGNLVTQLNTSDPGNAYDDIYPTWSPFRTVFSIAYSSNRSVTYTTPGTGAASETAISIGAGGALGNGGTVGASYAGILESQVVNLDPPTLVPYNGNEVLHVNAGTAYNAAVSSRTGITPGQYATITVRLSDREAGVDDNNIYLQIKNPNSKYQTASGSNNLEHKVFAHDPAFRLQTNNLQSQDSGSSDLLINGDGIDTGGTGRFGGGLYTGYNQFNINGVNEFFPQRGSVGGIDGPESGVNNSPNAVSAPLAPTANKSDTISVGRDGGGFNAQPVLDANGKQVLDANMNPAQLPGGDPTKFIPTGPEYECQVVNPNFAGLDTVPTDFTNPYYLAGVDDQQPFSGNAAYVVRPATEYLQMTRLPAAQQDGQGGILYSVTLRTPATGSDFFLDVIAFDLAAPPPNYVPLVAAPGSPGVPGSNWRIYDNVWGFSTAAADTTNDILLVSDYALGQKFAASTFGGQRGLVNLVPKLFGAESYVSDIDAGLLPNAIYRNAVYTGANAGNPQPEVLDLSTSYDPADNPLGFQENYSIPVLPLNGLGVNSYYDRFIDDNGRSAEGLPQVRSQQYSLWRTLSRGPVPASIYAAYEPTIQTQPAVSDASGATKVSVAAGPVAVANRCIVWISPFTGDVLAGPGTLADPSTQTNLRAFVKAGGRLCVSGQDVGSALTQNGTVNNTTGGFLSDVLNATLVSSNQGTHIPEGGNTAASNRISYSPFYDGSLQGGYQEIDTEFSAGSTFPGVPGEVTVAPSARPIIISNNFGGNIFEISFNPNAGNFGNWRTDGSLDQLGPYIQGFPEQFNNTNSVVAQIDTIKPNAGANVHTDLTLQPFTNTIGQTDAGNVNAASAPGGVGLIYSESLLAAGGTGSRVVYSTFGLEALSTEYYRQTSQFKPNPILYAARNQRQNILHNIVSYLRTGSISGTIRATTGNNTVGSGIPGATVYLASANGPAIPGRGTFSATTDSSGNYTISGVETGVYTLVAYANGYTEAVSNKGTVFTVEGDVAVAGANLTLQQAGQGSITGVVTDSSGAPVSGATVTFTPSGGGTTQRTTTQSNGTYTLANVPAGTYTGTATFTGSAATAGPVAVVTGQTITVNFKLTPGVGNASGRVVDTNGNPIFGATVFFNSGGVTQTATTQADGTYTFPASGLAAGSYIVTASATGYGNSTPTQVTITSATTTAVPDIVLGAVQNGTLGGLVTASGGTTPLAGVTITIVNTATNVAVTPAPTSSGTATAAPDGSGSINYGPVTLPQGTYTVTASQNGVSSPSQSVTVPANGFVRADFTGTTGLAPLHVFPAGIQFVSTPFDYSALGFSGLFGTLNTAATGAAANGNRSNVAVWNPLVGAYALDPNAPADALRPGIGYWVYLKNATPVTQAGTTVTGSVQVSLNPAWNQIGAPSTAGIPISSLTFTGSDGIPHSFADATSSTYHLVSPTLYSYNGSSYQALSAGATLQPWQGYWIEVYTPVTMSIPTGK